MAGFDPNKIRSIGSVRRTAALVFIACDEEVAQDIAAELNWAADEIERLSMLLPGRTVPAHGSGPDDQ